MAKKKAAKSKDGSIEVFSDITGRTLIGEVQGTQGGKFVVKNPAIIHVQGNGQGQWQVSVFPLLFNEFLDGSSKENGTTWEFPEESIVTTDAKVVDQLITQYNNVFNPAPIVAPQGAGNVVSPDGNPAGAPKVVKLFDE